MAFTTNELDGREIAQDRSEYRWAIVGTGTDAEAMTAILSAAPSTVTTKDSSGTNITQYRVDEDIRLTETVVGVGGDDSLYIATVPYFWNEPSVGAEDESFAVRGEVQHITTSRSTISSHVASGTAPDFKQLIGVTKDNVEGTDIVVPNAVLTVTHRFASVSQSDRNTIAGLVGKVNNASFKGYDAGEVLLLGSSEQQGTTFTAITFEFGISKNQTGLSIGGITMIDKKGWEYLWVYYGDDVDQDTLVKKPLAVYIEKVYETGDFSNLGLN